MVTILKKCDDDNITIHSASLTYTTVLNFIPIIAMAYFAFEILGGLDKFQSDIERFISENLAPNFGDQILGFINSVRNQISAKALGVFGAIGFVLAGINLLAKIELSLNLIWGKKRARPWMQKMSTFWTLISLGPILLGVSLVVTGNAVAWLRSDHGEIARVIVFAWQFIPYVTSTMLMTMVYMWLPAHKVHFKNAFKAGVISGVIFEVAKQLYAMYAIRAISSSIYGSLAVAPVFLLWLNFVWMIFLFGAQVCYFLNEKPGQMRSV